MRTIVQLLMGVLVASGMAWGQAGTTLVTATVQDSSGNLYSNCTWSAVFLGQNTSPGVGPYAPANLLVGQQGTCDGNAQFSVSLADNVNTVTPSPSQWSFNICSASNISGGPYCKANIPITITGATQNISSTLTPFLPLLPTSGGSTPGTPSGSIQGNNSGHLGGVPNTSVNFGTGAATVSAPWTFSGEGSAGNISIKWPTADAVLYVDASGSDSNDGLSWGTAKATIAAAVSALPTCTLYGPSSTASSGGVGNTSFPCGDIYLRPGSYSGGWTVSSPLIMIHGPQRGTAKINCGSSSPCLTFDPFTGGTTFFSQYTPTLRYGLSDLQIDGNGVTSNQIGMKCTDCLAITLDHVLYSDFNSTGAVGLDEEIDASSPTYGSYAESQDWSNVTFSNDTTGLLFNNPTSTAGYGTFDYSRMRNLIWLMWSGQTAISSANYAHCDQCEISGDTHQEGTISSETIWSVGSNSGLSGQLDVSVDQGVFTSGITYLTGGGAFSAHTQHGAGTSGIYWAESGRPGLTAITGYDICWPDSGIHDIRCDLNGGSDQQMLLTPWSNYIDVGQISAPSNPSSGFQRLYATTGGLLACLTSGGGNCLPTGSFQGGAGTSYQDAQSISTPSDPASSYNRLYVSSSTGFLSCLTSSGGNCMPSGAFASGLGTSYQDVEAITTPADPSSGNIRIYGNSGSGLLACINSSGSSCMPPAPPASPALGFQFANAGATALASTTPGTNRGTYNPCRNNTTQGTALSPSECQVGLAGRSITGSTSTDTVLYTDVNTCVNHDLAATASVTETLHTPADLNNTNFALCYTNHSPNTDTIQPCTSGAGCSATFTIQNANNAAASNLLVSPGESCRLKPDPNSATNWLSDCNNIGTLAATQGKDVTGTGPSANAQGAGLKCDSFSGADVGAKSQGCINALGAVANGRVDLSGLTAGPVTLTSPLIPATMTPSGVDITLGPGPITVNQPVVLQSRVRLLGVGTQGIAGLGMTFIEPGSTFPQACGANDTSNPCTSAARVTTTIQSATAGFCAAGQLYINAACTSSTTSVPIVGTSSVWSSGGVTQALAPGCAVGVGTFSSEGILTNGWWGVVKVGTIVTDTGFTMSRPQVVGTGTSGNSAFAKKCPLIQLSDGLVGGYPAFGVQMTGVGLDAGDKDGIDLVEDFYCQEKCLFTFGQFRNYNDAIGFDEESTGSQNGGFFADNNFAGGGTAANVNTIDVYNASSGDRTRWEANTLTHTLGQCTNGYNVAIVLENATAEWSNSHMEGCGSSSGDTAMQIGQNSTVIKIPTFAVFGDVNCHSCFIHNNTFGSATNVPGGIQTALSIGVSGNLQDSVTISGITNVGNVANLIVDPTNTITKSCVGSFLGNYTTDTAGKVTTNVPVSCVTTATVINGGTTYQVSAGTTNSSLTSGGVLTAVSSTAQHIGSSGTCTGQIYTATSSITQYQLVSVTGTTVVPASASGSPVTGVAQNSASATQSVNVCFNGITSVLMDGPWTQGDIAVNSSYTSGDASDSAQTSSTLLLLTQGSLGPIVSASCTLSCAGTTATVRLRASDTSGRNPVSNIPGIIPDGKRNIDGAMASLVTSGSSTSPATVSTYATNFNGDYALTLESWYGNVSLSSPTGTSVVSTTPAASKYALAVYSQTISTAGTDVSSMGGTLGSSTPWMGIMIPWKTDGTSITPDGTGETVVAASNATITLTVSSQTSGDPLLACIAFGNAEGVNYIENSGTTWQPIKISTDLSTTFDQTTCFVSHATTTNTSVGYVFTQAQGASGGAMSGVIVALPGAHVSYPDELFSSSSATFVAATDTAGANGAKDICVAGAWGAYGVYSAPGSSTVLQRLQGPAPNSNWIGGQVYLNSTAYQVSEVSGGSTTTATFTNSSASIGATNSFFAGLPVQFTTTGSLPTNFSVGTTYYVLSTSLSSSNFEVAATPGGTAITAGSAGSGTQTVIGEQAIGLVSGTPSAANYSTFIPSSPQSCGTIGTVISATTIVGWGIWNPYVGTTAFEYHYGTDNTTVINNALGDYPNGGKVILPPGTVMVSGELSLTSALNLEGQGTASMYNNFYGGNTGTVTAVGSEIFVASTTLSTPAFNIVPANPTRYGYRLADFTLTCGAGRAADGCGTSGLKTTAVSRMHMLNVQVSNAATYDINILGGASSGEFTNQIKLEHVAAFIAGLDPVYLNCGSPYGCQNIEIDDSMMELGNNADLEINLSNGSCTVGSGCNLWTLKLDNDDISSGVQIPSSGEEIEVDTNGDSVLTGCQIDGLYAEWDGVANIGLTNSFGLANCGWGPNTQVNAEAGVFTNVPPQAGQLQNGMIATTQTSGDNSTKVATTAYVNTAVTLSGAPQCYSVSATQNVGSSSPVTISSLTASLTASTNYTFHLLLIFSQATQVSDSFGAGISSTPTARGWTMFGYDIIQSTFGKVTTTQTSSGNQTWATLTPTNSGNNYFVMDGILGTGSGASPSFTFTASTTTPADTIVIQPGSLVCFTPSQN